MRRLVAGSLIVAACLVASLIAAPGLAAQELPTANADLRGDWEGDYNTTIGVFRNTLRITDEDFTTGAVRGTANAGADTLEGTVSGNTFTFSMARPGYTAFSTGTVSADGSTITGDFTRDTNGRSGTFLLRRSGGPVVIVVPGGSPAPGASAAPTTPATPGASAAPMSPPTTPSGPGGGSVGSQPGPEPQKLEYVLPGPFEISLAPQDVARSVGIMTFVMLLIGAPTPIFNSTLSANRALIERWARRRRPRWLRGSGTARRSGTGGTLTPAAARASLSHTWTGLVLYLLLATLVYAFLDSAFPVPDGARIFFTTLVGIAIGTAVSQLPGEWYVRKRYGGRGTVDVALWTIVLGAACVAITRVTGFQPGYVYGIIGGFTFTVALSQDDKGRMAFRGMVLLLAVGVAAWLARVPFQPLNGAVGGDIGALANHILAGLFTSAVQGAAIALIPLRFLAGDRILALSRLRWIVLWGMSILLFAHVLLYPVSSFTPHPSESGLWTLVAVVIVYSAIALGFWWFFQKRAIRRARRRARTAVSGHEAQGDAV